MRENPCSNQEIHLLFAHGLNLIILKMSYYTESIADQTHDFADAFVWETLRKAMTFWRRFDFRKFTADATLFREIQCKKMDFLMFNSVFSANLIKIR